MNDIASFIVPLEQANRSQVQLVGSKGANLGELLRLGLHVPNGFCVTTSAYEHFVTKSGIVEELARLSRDALKNPSLISSRARELILKSQIPDDLKQEIVHSCRSLADGYSADGDNSFAVRSSAVDEDLNSESFAGIHESYLNITTLECLLARLQDCWASFWSERALIYREVRKLYNRHITGAVIIQKMIQARAAGVLFTMDPASGSRSFLIIEAHQGAGEELVSGAVTPQRYTVSRAPLRIASKYLCCIAAENSLGDRQLATSTRVSCATALSDAEVLELSQLGIAIERFYGTPQDIEWIKDAEGFRFLQARPVTTVEKPTTGIPDPNVWTRHSINERFPQPLKPLESSFVADCVFTPGFTQLFKSLSFPELNGSDVFRSFAGVAYLNKRLIAQSLKGVPEGAAVQILERSTECPVVPLSVPLLFTVFRLLKVLLFTHHEFERALPRFIRSFEEFRRHDFSELTLPELIAELTAMAHEIKQISRSHMKSVLIAELLFAALESFDPMIRSLLPALTRGNQANKSVEMSARFSELVHLAQNCETVRNIVFLDDTERAFELLQRESQAQEFYCRLRIFLEDFGHRSAMYQLSHPRWIEEPGQVIKLIQNELRMPRGRRHEYRSDAELSRLKATAEWQISGSGVSRFFPLKSLWLRFLLKFAQIYSGVLRENEGFYITMMFPQVKRALRHISAELVRCSALAEQDDIYYLTFAEVCHSAGSGPAAAVGVEALVSRKREFLRATSPESAIHDEALGSDLATGAPASPGRVSGTAVVLSHPADQFTPGAILVTHTLNSSWVSALRAVTGVVTEVGGMLSHGAVLAREFGIPAVLGAGPITRRIHTGQHITVDGTKGHVYIN